MTIGVLLMAYGSPSSPEEVLPYLRDIRGGREPSTEAVEELLARYQRVGWSPLLEITGRQAAALEKRLNSETGADFRTYVGMKHWHPFISDAVREMASDEIESAVGLVLAPHYSSMSIGGYRERAFRAIDDQQAAFEFRMIDRWWDLPSFVDLWRDGVLAALDGWDGADPSTHVFFTAHSLPARIVDEGDPYQDELMASASAIAEAAKLGSWSFAFQSASHTGTPWLGPDILESLETFAGRGGARALVAPIGFVSDHLEIQFDIDVECVETAARLGLELRRTASPNDSHDFIECLAGAVNRALAL